MRISDWSSDVCSSDLAILIVAMLAIGLALGWFAGNRGAAAMRAERDARAEDFRKAIIDLAGAEERARAVDGLRAELVALRNEPDGARTGLATPQADARDRKSTRLNSSH